MVDEISRADDTVFLTGEDPNSAREVRRTGNHRVPHKFNSPIIVNEEQLFTPVDLSPRRQINVQIIEPESHNNGQFLKETTFVKEENSTVVSSTSTTTSTTTESSLGALVSSTQLLPAKFLAPIQAGLRLSNDAKQRLDDDCDDTTTPVAIVENTSTRKEEQRTVVNVHKNVRVNKIVHLPGPYGSRKLVGPTTQKPCGKLANCDEKIYLPPPTIPVQVETHVVQQPIYIHTQTEVPVEKIVEKPVPYPVEVEKVVNVPYVVEKIVNHQKIVDRPVSVPVPYEVERLVVKEVKIPVDRIVEKHIPVEVERIVEKIIDRPVEIEKPVPYPVEVERVVDRIVEKPVPVPYDRIHEKIIDRPVEVEKPVPYPVGVPIHVPYYVEVPIHTPYLVEKNVPYPVHVHVPYLVKSPPKQHYFFKATKSKDHGIFDFKHGHQKSIKHIFVKPNLGLEDHGHSHPYPFETFGLLPPPISYQSLDSIHSPSINHIHHLERKPRFQSIDGYASASVNVINTALPLSSYNSFHTNHFHPYKDHLTHHHSRPNYSGGLNVKELRWEYGFKPPLIPSTEIDDFGNPIKRNII